jgi:hypothetical protein
LLVFEVVLPLYNLKMRIQVCGRAAAIPRAAGEPAFKNTDGRQWLGEFIRRDFSNSQNLLVKD